MISVSDLFKQQFNVECEADAPHKEKYRFLINLLGFENVRKCLPFTDGEIKRAFRKDYYLNNLKLSKWDKASGFDTRFRGQVIKRCYAPINDLLKKHNLYLSSVSNGVSLLKECARMVAEE